MIYKFLKLDNYYVTALHFPFLFPLNGGWVGCNGRKTGPATHQTVIFRAHVCVSYALPFHENDDEQCIAQPIFCLRHIRAENGVFLWIFYGFIGLLFSLVMITYYFVFSCTQFVEEISEIKRFIWCFPNRRTRDQPPHPLFYLSLRSTNPAGLF